MLETAWNDACTCDLRSAIIGWWIPGQLAVFGVDVTHLQVLRRTRLVYKQQPAHIV